MKQMHVMIKPASSACNMRCKYCFYCDVVQYRENACLGIMQDDTTEKMLENIFVDMQNGDSLTLSFQGGEPTLAGLPYFERLTELVKKQKKGVKVSYALQTNGCFLDDAWCAFFKKHDFLIGISIDGPASMHNANRLDAKGSGTFSQILEGKRRLDRFGVAYNVLCVLTGDIARHPQRIWKFLLDEKVRYVQFTPCLDDLDAKEKNPWALTPQRFYHFYSGLFPLWKQAAEQGNYISVKFFDDVVNLFVRRQVTACGFTGQCQPQFVVESDGSVYPCDFYVLDEYCLGNFKENTLEKLYQAAAKCPFGSRRAALPPLCRSCPYKQVCGGGCKRMEKAMYVREDYCGYRQFLDNYLSPLCQVGQWLLSR